jgi:Asp-tRNA(Asn)/Glu-tRNA(Gln) amidotransferase B subunit
MEVTPVHHGSKIFAVGRRTMRGPPQFTYLPGLFGHGRGPALVNQRPEATFLTACAELPDSPFSKFDRKKYPYPTCQGYQIPSSIGPSASRAAGHHRWRGRHQVIRFLACTWEDTAKLMHDAAAASRLHRYGVPLMEMSPRPTCAAQKTPGSTSHGCAPFSVTSASAQAQGRGRMRCEVNISLRSQSAGKSSAPKSRLRT